MILDELLKKEYPNENINYTERNISLRINPLKGSKEDILKELTTNNITYQEVNFYDMAYILNTKDLNKIKELNCYKNGQIYLQSLSSMIPAILLNPKENESILDMCASPGGKTTLMGVLSNNKAMITACEKNKERLERLKYNIEKQGVKKILVMQIDSRNLNDNFLFDKILLDTPCSGSGTLTTSKEFDYELFQKLPSIQTSLIKKALKLLKKGGILIYSTCSILKEENENILTNILNDVEVEKIDISNYQDIELLPSKIANAITIKPNKYYEGFFISYLRKK